MGIYNYINENNEEIGLNLIAVTGSSYYNKGEVLDKNCSANPTEEFNIAWTTNTGWYNASAHILSIISATYSADTIDGIDTGYRYTGLGKELYYYPADVHKIHISVKRFVNSDSVEPWPKYTITSTADQISLKSSSTTYRTYELVYSGKVLPPYSADALPVTITLEGPPESDTEKVYSTTILDNSKEFSFSTSSEETKDFVWNFPGEGIFRYDTQSSPNCAIITGSPKGGNGYGLKTTISVSYRSRSESKSFYGSGSTQTVKWLQLDGTGATLDVGCFNLNVVHFTDSDKYGMQVKFQAHRGDTLPTTTKNFTVSIKVERRILKE